MTAHIENMRHWYREPWPWLLMAGPAAVIVAGVITTYLAVVTNDGLVADDYYKQGLAINQTLSRDVMARQLNYRARIVFAPDYGRVTVNLLGDSAAPGQLVMRLSHPGRPSLDRNLPLMHEGNQSYASTFPSLIAGHWQVILEDSRRSWRLVGDLAVPGRGTIDLAPR
jgi:hypothetical protein